MITIRGSTFAHRDHLKSIGARWNADKKCWTHSHLSDASRTDLIARGMILSGGTRAPMPGTGPQPVASGPEPMPAVKPRSPAAGPLASPAVHGTDDSYREHFATKRTLAFFGFASLAEHVDFVRRTPAAVVNETRDNRNTAWKLPRKITGTDNMSEALELAANGWQEGADKASELLELLQTTHATRKQRRHGVAGGSVNVGRMLAGNPMHMRHRPKRDATKITTLFVDCSASIAIPANDMLIRAILVAALADALENNGYSCEIIAASAPLMHGANVCTYQATTRVKSAGERLNLADVVFALGHPSFLRRLVFATVANEERCRKIWDYMGTPAPLFTEKHLPAPNELHVDKIRLDQYKKIKGTTTIERVLSMFPMIIPANFPVQLELDK